MEIDVQKTVGEISPLWFGHNLEHTRSCVWRGLSAQLIRNRKFVGASGRHGVARHWYRIGPKGCLYLLERAAGAKNMQGETYTTRFESVSPGWDTTRQRQRMEAFESGARHGIGQRGVPLVGNREYEGRLALLSDRQLAVRVGLRGQEPERKYFETTVKTLPGQWREHRFTFVAPATDEDAHFEITFDGPGVLHVGAVALLPADNFQGMRRDVIELLKEISVPILRWPGGNFAGCYRWKDGLLPVDRRAPLPGAGILPHTDGFDDHEIGTDEFVALCREIQAEPWITINMGLEGPVEAREWVEYCNGSPDTEWGAIRAARGHPEPYGVKYWSLGNEMGYGHMKGPNTPREYAEMAADCSRAMRQADPSIVLVASGTWWKEEWFRTVLAEVGDSFDHIAFHEYTALMKEFRGEEGEKEFRRIAGAPSQTLEALREVRQRLDTYAPGGKFVGISFDEWNVWYAWFRVPGVVEGIYTAAMLNMFCREARRIGMTMGAYFEPVNEGAILVEPASARLTPAGQVFSLFKAHQGNQLIELEACGADAESERPQGADRPGASLDVVASVAEAKNEVTVTLVNRHPEEDCEAEISLKNVSAIVTATGALLTSPTYLPESEFTEEELEVTVKDDRALAVTVPAHSVARMSIVCR